MTDFSNSVIMPREDFIELSQTAFDNSHVPTLGERVASTTQTYTVFGGLAVAIVACTWGCTKAVDWLENRRLARHRIETDIDYPKTD